MWSPFYATLSSRNAADTATTGKANPSRWHLPVVFSFSPLAILLATTTTWVLALVIVALGVALVATILYYRGLASQRDEAVHTLEVKEKDLQSLRTEFDKTLEDLMAARRTVERKSRDLRMINHILDLKVERQTRELQEANADLSTFLYRSSHDILGPMARLTGLCNLAQMEVNDPVALDYLGKLSRTAGELNQIIKNINEVFEIKNRELILGTCPLRQKVLQVIEEEFEEGLKGETEFVVDIEEDLAITNDLELLQIILVEIVKNSLIHRSSYGSDRSKIHIVAERRSRKVLMTVDDNGTGVPKELEKKIFDMFQRSSEMVKGTGMGLYIVKCALHRMKGSIELKPKDTPGARFELQIPNFQSVV